MVFGVLYVVLEMVIHHLETVGWGRITPLDVATALVDALLAIVVAIAVLLAVDLGRARWGPALRAWQRRQLAAASAPRGPIGVPSWRPGADPPVPPAPGARPGRPSAVGTYGVRPTGRRFPEDPGRLL